MWLDREERSLLKWNHEREKSHKYESNLLNKKGFDIKRATLFF